MKSEQGRRPGMELSSLDWKEEYSVGFKLIDEQHKRLFTIYNQLVAIKQNEVRSKKVDPDVLKKIVAELVDYVHIHFLVEEEVMRVYGYRDLADHKKLHEQFAELVDGVATDFQKDQLVLINSFVIRIKNWLVHHVLEEDHKYKEIFKK